MCGGEWDFIEGMTNLRQIIAFMEQMHEWNEGMHIYNGRMHHHYQMDDTLARTMQCPSSGTNFQDLSWLTSSEKCPSQTYYIRPTLNHRLATSMTEMLPSIWPTQVTDQPYGYFRVAE